VGVGNLMEILLSPKEFSLTFQLTIHSWNFSSWAYDHKTVEGGPNAHQDTSRCCSYSWDTWNNVVDKQNYLKLPSGSSQAKN
jgi:hypothetical protein